MRRLFPRLPVPALAALPIAAALCMPVAVSAQSSSSSSSSAPSSSAPSASGGGMAGGSSGAQKTERAPSAGLRTGPQPDAGPRGNGLTSGSSGPGAGPQSRVPDECLGTTADPRCPTAAAPTGTGLGDRGTDQSARRPYDADQSPVQGGPRFDAGPTGRPLNLPGGGGG